MTNFSGKKIAASDAEANKHPDIGRRVTVMVSASKGEELLCLGEGTVVRVTPSPEDPHPCPLITLDLGGHVYGCECWWGEAEKMQKTFGNKLDLKKWHVITRGESGQIVKVEPLVMGMMQ